MMAISDSKIGHAKMSHTRSGSSRVSMKERPKAQTAFMSPFEKTISCKRFGHPIGDRSKKSNSSSNRDHHYYCHLRRYSIPDGFVMILIWKL